MKLFRKKEIDPFFKLFEIPCDYDGYDLVFEQGKTSPDIYYSINEIITNGKYEIKTDKIKHLTIDSSLDEFYVFYDEWLEELLKEGFVFRLDAETPIEEFAQAIIKMLKIHAFEAPLNENDMIEHYKHELREMGINEAINYDVLMANTAAAELRRYKIELIDLFDGFSNCDFAIIPEHQIPALKKLEESVK
ncbi:hypothetical protein B5E77_07860 [Lachnoclostridium sp. An131]|uniref:hypothetical protein n=1 Tax=Lachnoclostridium sp. An131 TaxID=1965555 RepID=UPI000B36DC17|nr:hypothetical protein [Lachnoclostridium sp. An131]OUQ27072.1 hypothetical protein B5E77_07860 [Lachnoclostridium sp. An131]